MASMLKKGMSWLGLGPEEDYDDYYDDGDYVDDGPLYGDEPSGQVAIRPVAGPTVISDHEWDEPQAESGAVRMLSPQPARQVATGVTPIQPLPERSRSVVRPLPSTVSSKPHVVTPTAFNDAQDIGDWFKKRQPVIVNLQGLDRDLARRLLDFASGVAYGLGGGVERVASHVYLLTPVDVEVSDDDRERYRSGSFAEG